MLGRTYFYPWMRFGSVDKARDGWNLYAYVGNSPINYVDPDGHALDVIFDVGAIVYDIGDIAVSLIGGEGVSNTQVLTLAADVLGAAVPLVTGLGAAVRAGTHVDEAVDAGRAVDAALDAGSGAAQTTKSLSAVPKGGAGFNPFKGKTPAQIDEMLRSKGFAPKGPNPVAGKGTYVNPKTGRSVHIDANHPPPKPPHVSVQRPRGSRDLPPREFPLDDG
jgi:hypothetical protein